jgi:DNA-binding NtrC family response regulator
MREAPQRAGRERRLSRPPPESSLSAAGRAAGRVLIVDDEQHAKEALEDLLEDEGYTIASANDGQEALEMIESFEPEVVVTDLKMPRMDGLELLARGKALDPHVAFVVMTAFGTIDTAVEAIKRGAENYLTKPLDLDALTALIERALEKARLSREAADLRSRLDRRLSLGKIVGDHPRMQRLLKMVAQVAPSRATVLIHGESGTGKELIAERHPLTGPSARNGPFVATQLRRPRRRTSSRASSSGTERGRLHRGDVAAARGLFELADGGTLFLDEVSEIPLNAAGQAPALAAGAASSERVGGERDQEGRRPHRRGDEPQPREAMVEPRARFREDLFYRLKVFPLRVPPLRERPEDIALLAGHFLTRYSQEFGREVQGFSQQAMEILSAYEWPGNVRELENEVERAVVLSTDPEIDAELLPQASTGGKDVGADELSLLIPGLTLAELERMAIERTLSAVDGSTAKAAEILGISRRKIQYRLKEWAAEGADEEE